MSSLAPPSGFGRCPPPRRRPQTSLRGSSIFSTTLRIAVLLLFSRHDGRQRRPLQRTCFGAKNCDLPNFWSSYFWQNLDFKVLAWCLYVHNSNVDCFVLESVCKCRNEAWEMPNCYNSPKMWKPTQTPAMLALRGPVSLASSKQGSGCRGGQCHNFNIIIGQQQSTS